MLFQIYTYQVEFTMSDIIYIYGNATEPNKPGYYINIKEKPRFAYMIIAVSITNIFFFHIDS